MSKDNELREMIEVHLGQAGVLGRIDPTLEKNLINDLISDITLAINQTKAEAVENAKIEGRMSGLMSARKYKGTPFEIAIKIDRELSRLATLKQFQESK